MSQFKYFKNVEPLINLYLKKNLLDVWGHLIRSRKSSKETGENFITFLKSLINFCRDGIAPVRCQHPCN